LTRATLWTAKALAVCAWATLAVVLIFVRGRELDLDRGVTSRLRYHAIPVAMSVLYHGHPHDYTASRFIAIPFQHTDMTLTERIAWAVSAEPPQDDDTYYWLADDRGMADYVLLSFRLFGPTIKSLYSFYFVVFSASVALFLIGYRHSPAMIGLLLVTLAAIYTVLPVIPLASISSEAFIGEPPSLFEPRILDLLAMVATIHLAFAGWTSERPRGWWFAFVGQFLLFVFCYHARSSLAWEGVFIAMANSAAIAWAVWRPPVSHFARVRVAAMPLLCVVAGFVALTAYKRITYNPRYFRDSGQRTVWHNALMGFGSNPTLSSVYKLGIRDAAVVDAVLQYLHDHNDPRLGSGWDTTKILNSLGGHGEFNWYAYETAARDLYFQVWRDRPRDALRCYVVNKPREVLSVVRTALTWEHTPQRDSQDLYFRPFDLTALVIALPGVLMLAGRQPLRFLPSIAALAFCSALPAFLFYAVPLTMMGTFVAGSMLVYVAAAAMTARVTGRLSDETLAQTS